MRELPCLLTSNYGVSSLNVFLDSCECVYVSLVCGYWTTDIKLRLLLMLRLYYMSKRDSNKAKGSESTLCIWVGPDGVASHDRF